MLHWQVKSLFLLFHWLETNLACWLVDAGNIGVFDPIYAQSIALPALGDVSCQGEGWG